MTHRLRISFGKAQRFLTTYKKALKPPISVLYWKKPVFGQTARQQANTAMAVVLYGAPFAENVKEMQKQNRYLAVFFMHPSYRTIVLNGH